MESVTQKRRPSVHIDPTLEHTCSDCGKSYPRTNEYFHTRGKGSTILVNICKWCQSDRDRESKKASNAKRGALTLTDPRPVVFDDLGTRASVGWYGDVEYFPITPLLALTKYETEHGLLGAIRGDALTRDLPRKFVIAGFQNALWCFPWSHFSTFCFKFGNEQTLPQQQRAQQVIESAFGKTAQSNRDAAAHMDLAPIQRQAAATHNEVLAVRADLVWVKQKLETVDGLYHFANLPGGVYLARFAVEEFTNPASRLERFGVREVASHLSRGYVPACIGKFSGASPYKRIAGHHGKLLLDDISVLLTWSLTDYPPTCETHLRGTAPAYPVAFKLAATDKRLKDWFWVLRSWLDEQENAWPSRVLLADMVSKCKGWRYDAQIVYAQAELF